MIKDLVPPVSSTAGDLLTVLDGVEVSETTLDAIDRIIKKRAESLIRVPTW